MPWLAVRGTVRRTLINCLMVKSCCSANRCAEITCVKCARRHANRIAREVQHAATGRTCAIAIDAGAFTLTEFRNWRIELRNIVDYRRRASRWWNTFSLRLWLSRDGCTRGVVNFGSVTEDEVLEVLGVRWSTTLRPVAPEGLRDELYTAVRPDVIMTDEPYHARYQFRQLTIRAQRKRRPLMCRRSTPLPSPYDEPMPLLF
jgi:hypothetical protein